MAMGVTSSDRISMGTPAVFYLSHYTLVDYLMETREKETVIRGCITKLVREKIGKNMFTSFR